MSLTIVGRNFQGPFSSTSSLEDKSGVYVIVTRRNSSEKYTIVDVGESATVKTRVANHDRSNCWSRNNLDKLAVSVCYTPNLGQPGRKELEQEIRGMIWRLGRTKGYDGKRSHFYFADVYIGDFNPSEVTQLHNSLVDGVLKHFIQEGVQVAYT